MAYEYEVDFIAVGDASKSGDAIALRFGNLTGPRNEQCVVVIDGGTKETGAEVVEVVRNRYDTEIVDIVVSTHPDADHASGLSVVLDELKVNRLWMHQPWNHSEHIHHLFEDGRITEDSLDRRLRESLEHAHELEKIAKKKGIPIDEPFSGETSHKTFLRVLGPSRKFYQELLPHFRDCPELKIESSSVLALMSNGFAAVAEAVKTVFESWTIETLSDPDSDATDHAENNSSVILLLEVNGNRVLFTADAAAPALDKAVDFAVANGIDLKTVPRIQIPHHGSKRNVGPTILNRIIGPKLPSEGVATKSAIVSVAKDGAPKHPAKKVLNAFKRRGCNTAQTKGNNLTWSSPGAPQRPGYSPATIDPLYSQVDE